MAVKQVTVTVDGSFDGLNISGTTENSSYMTWTLPELPENATIISTNLTANVVITMSKGAVSYVGFGEGTDKKITSTGRINYDLGTTLIDKYKVYSVGSNKNASGTITCHYIVYTITYSYEESTCKVMHRISGSWVEIKSVYRKIDNVWTLINDLESIKQTFNGDIKYRIGSTQDNYLYDENGNVLYDESGDTLTS